MGGTLNMILIVFVLGLAILDLLHAMQKAADALPSAMQMTAHAH